MTRITTCRGLSKWEQLAGAACVSTVVLISAALTSPLPATPSGDSQVGIAREDAHFFESLAFDGIEPTEPNDFQKTTAAQPGKSVRNRSRPAD